MLEIIKVNPEAPEPDAIARAAELIRAGEVVGIPTDTVYGLACDAFNAAAAEKVFLLKGRTASSPLLLLVDSVAMAQSCAASLPALFGRLAERFWPGPLTIVVPASTRIPAAVTAGTGNVGLRLPSAPVARALIRAVGGPITASSANRSGAGECFSAQAVAQSVGPGLQFIVDGGASPSAKPSTVVSVVHQEVELLREGAISRKEIEEWLRGA